MGQLNKITVKLHEQETEIVKLKEINHDLLLELHGLREKVKTLDFVIETLNKQLEQAYE